jgi:hypothetical protein
MTCMPPTVRQSSAKIGFVCLLDYFTFLTLSFTCLLGQLRITRWWAGIRLRRHPLEPDGRIRWQRRGAIVLVSVVFGIVLSSRTIVLSSRTYCFAFYCHELECLAIVYTFLYILLVSKASHPRRRPK